MTIPVPPASDHHPATRLVRAGFLLGPPGVVLLAWWLLRLATTTMIANEALLAGGIFLTIVGPAVIFGPAVVGPNVFSLGTWDLVGVTSFFSLATSFFYAFNLDLLERVPRLGPWVHGVRENMRLTLAAKPWIRRWALFGVGFFVVLPLPGSGTLGGSVMARLVGLSRRASCLVVGTGGLIVCSLYGWLGEQLRVFGNDHELPTWAKIAVALLFVAALTLLGRWLARQRHRPGAEPPGNDNA